MPAFGPLRREWTRSSVATPGGLETERRPEEVLDAEYSRLCTDAELEFIANNRVLLGRTPKQDIPFRHPLRARAAASTSSRGK